MRATGRDIVELFGYSPDDTSEEAYQAWKASRCPFSGQSCTKWNHDQSKIYGTCSVSLGVSREVGSEVVICPTRIYANDFEVLKMVAQTVWPSVPTVLVGGSAHELRVRMARVNEAVVAFGRNSVSEVQVDSGGQMSFDWVLQRYEVGSSSRAMEPRDFVAIEVQSIDTTGNYRENLAAYGALKAGKTVRAIPPSLHGLNWANVHKRLIPQLVRKGSLVGMCERSKGFFFIVPKVVFQKFQEVIGPLQSRDRHARGNISILQVSLGPDAGVGARRSLVAHPMVHYSQEELARASIRSGTEEAARSLDLQLRSMISPRSLFELES